MSNLTGKFISNTYQKLLQVDNINGANGDAPLINMGDARTTTKYNLLNGLGQNVPYLVIDNTVDGNGSIFLKNTIKDDPSSLWGIQIEDSGDGYGSSGLNFWRPSGSLNEGNKYLFLKRTGTTWVGFQSQDIFNDVIEFTPPPFAQSGYRGTYTLYVSDGILIKGVSRQVDNTSNPTPSLAIGAPTTGGSGTVRAYQKLNLGNDMADGSRSELSIISNHSRLEIYGSASNSIRVVDNNFDFFMDPYNGGTFGPQYHPFRIVRYKYDQGSGNNFLGPRTRQLVGDGNGNPPDQYQNHLINNDTAVNAVDVNKWSAVLVGWTRTTVDDPTFIDRAGAIIHCNPGENYWRVSFTVASDTTILSGPSAGPRDQDWYFDVMFIRKGFYDDFRPTATGDEGDAGNSNSVWGSVP